MSPAQETAARVLDAPARILDEPARPDAGRRAAALTLTAAGAVLCAPVAGRLGLPALASALAMFAGLVGVTAFAHALWTTATRGLAPDGGAS